MATVITRASKQKRMMQFYNMQQQHSMFYLCVAYDNRWTNNPIVPVETDTIQNNSNCTILGYQTFESMKFANVIMNPTEADKTNPNVIFYKDSYYQTISDPTQALNAGYTRIMMTFVLNKDEYFPVVNADGTAVMFNQLGLYSEVNPGSLPDNYFISVEDFNNLEDKGMLELIDNRSIQSRAADQREEINILLSF